MNFQRMFYLTFTRKRSLLASRTLRGVFRLIASVCLFTSVQTHAQGFLEMPDTADAPDLERQTMLLDLDIPGVRDREPNPEAGPRLNIKEFRLQGIVEYPELGITRKAITDKIEALRFELMQEGERTHSGFTLKELSEISELVVDIEKDTETEHVGPLEVQKFVFLIRDQLRQRGVTVGMIESVADTITQFYRERGFILAKAYIPKQQVRDGVVSITLLLGELGEVIVEDAGRVSTNLISRAFKRNIAEPVTNKRIDESLYLVNDIPGVRAQGFFSQGRQVGDTAMTIKVQEEKWVSGNLRLDNHGSETTSQNRAYADIYLHNPLGIGDELYLAVLNSYDPDSTLYGAIRYNSMIMSPRLRASMGYSSNDFVSRSLEEIGSSATFFTGKSDVSDVSIKYHFKRSRIKNFSLGVTYTDISTILDTTNGSKISEEAQKVSLSFDFDLLNEKRRHLYLGSFALHGADLLKSDDEIGGVDPESQDVYATFDASSLMFFKFPFTSVDTRVLAKLALQYAGSSTSKLNQISLTGPQRARGFTVNGLQADDGGYFGVDWFFNSPQALEKLLFGRRGGKILQPYVFFDSVFGLQHGVEDDGSEAKTKGTLANVGLGLRATYKQFNFSIAATEVLVDNVNTQKVETPVNNVYFEMQYSL